MSTIPFNKPTIVGNEAAYIQEVFKNGKFCGDGVFTKKCQTVLAELHNSAKALLTPSCTHAIEMTTLLLDLKEGDEVIMPSYTFVSAANALLLRGVKIVFVDIDPQTMNIDASLIKQAISPKTRAIMVMHYGGVACDMDVITKLAEENGLEVIEDAAQAIGCFYKGKPLGSFGTFGVISFHETKNIQCGEGGALLINNKKFVERAEIIREKGTNRSKFIRGEVDKYSWVDLGSSYLNSELSAAFLYAQLEKLEEVNNKKRAIHDLYSNKLSYLIELGLVETQHIPEECEHNGHVFYIKVQNHEVQRSLIDHLKANDIYSVFHYIPLHSAPFGKLHTKFSGRDIYTSKDAGRLIRLPSYYGLSDKDAEKVCDQIKQYFHSNELVPSIKESHRTSSSQRS